MKVADAVISLRSENCEMHSCLRWVMRMCRWWGFFPIEGLDKPYTTELKYNAMSLYSVYHVFTVLGQLMIAGTSLVGFLTHKVSLGTMFEHLVWIVSSVILIFSCMIEKTFSYKAFECFIALRIPYVFEYLIFDIWKGVFVEIIYIQAIFLWNFTDVMIMCVSIYLTEYFKALNKTIISGKQKSAQQWEKYRNEYSHLVVLLKHIDNQLSYFVLLSFFTDLYFVCLQLFSTLNKDNSSKASILSKYCDIEVAEVTYGVTYYLYHAFSFLFLLTKVLVMSLLSANVNSVAKRPLTALGDVHSSIYNITIQRFYRQIHYTAIAFSGVLFHVTRKVILEVVGTIITYELVLLQFKTMDRNHTSSRAADSNA